MESRPCSVNRIKPGIVQGCAQRALIDSLVKRRRRFDTADAAAQLVVFMKRHKHAARLLDRCGYRARRGEALPADFFFERPAGHTEQQLLISAG